MMKSLQEDNLLFSNLYTSIGISYIYGPSCPVHTGRVVRYGPSCPRAELSTGRVVRLPFVVLQASTA